jgi:hypothetical protein
MNEAKFKEKLQERLREKLRDPEVKVEKNKNLIYKVLVNENFEFEPNTPRKPKRGSYAFQTDLLITSKDGSLPLVVIETKYGGFSTHDVLTYSTKAQKHKEIYPYLRYGLVVGGENKIYNRFFTHNIGFDFAYALESVDNSDSIKDLAEILKCQIKNARSLLGILRNKNQTKKFNTIIKIQ